MRLRSPRSRLRRPAPTFLAIECGGLNRTSRLTRVRARHRSPRRSAAACCRRSVGAGMALVGLDTGAGALAAGGLAAGALAAGGLEAGVLLGVHSAITRTPSASMAAFGFHAVRVGLTHLSRTGSTAAQDSSLRCHCRSTHFIRSHLLTAPDPGPALGRRAWASIIGSPRGAFQPNKTVERNSFRSGREKDLESD